LLDEAVGQLREDDRKAVLLRFFQNLSHREIGVVLGLSENSANKRVERALEKLREYFSRRGITVSAALLSAAMAENSVQAAPVGLAQNVSSASLTAAGAATTGASLFLSLLMSTKIKVTLALVVCLVLVTTLAINWQRSSSPSVTDNAASALTAPTSKLAGPPSSSQPSASNRVEMPVLPAATPSTGSGATGPNTSIADPVAATPQKDLKSAIATGIHFLEANDLASTLKTLDPPGMLEMKRKAGLGDTEEEMAAAMRVAEPEADKLLRQQLDLFRAIQDLTPEITPDGKRAVYHLDPPVDDQSSASFIKVNGFWYYGSGAEADWNAPP
jgi:hypothetical protein